MRAVVAWRRLSPGETLFETEDFLIEAVVFVAVFCESLLEVTKTVTATTLSTTATIVAAPRWRSGGSWGGCLSGLGVSLARWWVWLLHCC
jgi:hypothetical protein